MIHKVEILITVEGDATTEDYAALGQFLEYSIRNYATNSFEKPFVVTQPILFKDVHPQ